MKKNPHIFLSEVLFASSDKAESRAISKMLKEGVIRKIAAKVYTSNLTDTPENIIKRNLFIVLGHLFPKAVMSHRSALEFQPTPGGHIFLTYSYTRNVSLPGITVHLMEGQKGTLEDTPFIEGLFVSCQERAFLENMQVSKRKGDESKTLPQHVIEEKLETIIRVNGEDTLNSLRDKARGIAESLQMEEEFEKLNTIIGALLSTRTSSILTSQLAMARAFGQPYDPMRLQLFQILFTELQQREYESFPDRNTTERAYRNFAFFESYFSNYIEGTEFELKDVRKIIETNQPMPARDEDSHDVLGTFYIVSNREEMKRVPQSADELIYLLQSRHRVMLSARPHKQPGMFKTENNMAGNTYFVDYNLVRGTLMKGFELCKALQKPFARAIFMMFIISEIHPFLDGNGRIARVMMNAELTSAGESKIIIPTVFRSDYLLALRRLSRQNDPSVFIHAMQKVRRFSYRLYGEDTGTMERFLNKCNAFEDPEEGVLRVDF